MSFEIHSMKTQSSQNRTEDKNPLSILMQLGTTAQEPTSTSPSKAKLPANGDIDIPGLLRAGRASQPLPMPNIQLHTWVLQGSPPAAAPK